MKIEIKETRNGYVFLRDSELYFPTETQIERWGFVITLAEATKDIMFGASKPKGHE